MTSQEKSAIELHNNPTTAAYDTPLGLPKTETPPPTDSRRLEFSDGSAVTMDTWQLDNRDIVRITPDIVRVDAETGQPAIPLYVGLGINGDRRLHWALTAFAQEYGGSTIGIMYKKPKGSARLIKTEGFDHPAPELEVNQANDLIEAMDLLGIQRANALTESRGNTRVEIAAVKRPDLFEHRYHQDPVGHDDEGYVGTHMSALRIAFDGIRHRLRRDKETDPLVAELKSQGVAVRATRHSLRKRRIEQKAVARAHHAKLTDAAAKNQYAPDQSVTYASDIGDPGIRASKLRQRIEPIEATGNGVRYVETNKGRHGIGQSRAYVQEIAQHFKES